MVQGLSHPQYATRAPDPLLAVCPSCGAPIDDENELTVICRDGHRASRAAIVAGLVAPVEMGIRTRYALRVGPIVDFACPGSDPRLHCADWDFISRTWLCSDCMRTGDALDLARMLDAELPLHRQVCRSSETSDGHTRCPNWPHCTCCASTAPASRLPDRAPGEAPAKAGRA